MSVRAPRGFDALGALFETLGIDPPTVEHEAAFTVEDARDLRGTIPGVHTKNLFLKDKKGALFLIVAPEDAAIDLKRVHEAIGARGRVSFGSANLLAEVLGVTPGSVTPLALVNDTQGRVRCVLHPQVAEAERLNVHPLRNTATVTLTRTEFSAIFEATDHEPLVMQLPEPGPPQAPEA